MIQQKYIIINNKWLLLIFFNNIDFYLNKHFRLNSFQQFFLFGLSMLF